MTGIPTEHDLRTIADQVWASYLDVDGDSPLVLIPAQRQHTDVSASVSVTGAWRGHVVIRCTDTASRNVAGALLGLEFDDVTTEDITDALGELANIIGGNIKSLLPEPSALSLPHVLLNANGGDHFPAVTQVCHLIGTWLDEPMSVSVLESTADYVGAKAP
jgi:chemotaxis protein CheX